MAVSERAGIPASRLLGAPSVSVSALKHPFRRVPWNAFCEYNERLEEAWAERGGLEPFARGFVPEIPEFRAVARMLLPPQRLMQLLLNVGTWAHPYTEAKWSSASPRHFAFTLTLPSSFRDSPSFLRMNGPVLAHATTLLGLPPAKVEMTLRPREADYHFELPPSRTLFQSAQDASQRFVGEMLERIEQLQSEVRTLRQATPSQAPRREAFADRLELTARQREVMELLARGASNRDIAQRLGCTERTVEVHVSEVLRKAGCRNRAQLVASYWAGGLVEIP